MIMITKYLFQNRNEQEVNPMFAVRNMLPLLLVVLLLCGLSFGGTLWTVKSGGGGDYTTIQAALNAAGPNDVTPWPITIEVQDNATYTENLVFPPSVSNPNDVNGLTLKAGTDFTPTIVVSGSVRDQNYIDIRSVGTTLKGFTINFSGLPWSGVGDSNSTIIKAVGGASKVLDCNIFGPSTGTFSTLIRGIAGVAEINHVEVSQCRQGILCDANWFDTGFNYSIYDSWIHDNYGWGIIFSDCNAVVDNCLIEKSGTPTAETANVMTQGTNSLLLNLLIKNSTIQYIADDAAATSRNFRLQTPGTVDINDCVIRGAKADEILQYRGLLNLNRCILKHNRNISDSGGCVAATNNEGQATGSYTNIDHCSLEGSPYTDGWALWTNDPNAHVTITNSILTGPNGYHTASAITTGFFISNYNDNDCNVPISGPAAQQSGVVAGPNDLRQSQDGPRFNPYYIQTTNSSNDANLITFFALQPYSPVIGKGMSDSNMGAKGVVYGYEKWPADIDGVYGVDKRDLQVFAWYWKNDNNNVIPPGPNSLVENFESKTAIPDVNCLALVTGGAYYGPTSDGWIYPTPITDGNYLYAGTSTVSLLKVSDGCDVYDGSKAMRWVYDVNMTTGYGRFTEILVILPQTIDINVFPGASGQPSSPYNQLKVMLNRHAGNSPVAETYMYVKFLDKTKSTPTTGYNKEDLVAHCYGGATDVNAGQWVPWITDLTRMTVEGAPMFYYPRLRQIGGIVFGIRDQPNGPWGLGQGTIDVDKIELVDLPGCSKPIAERLADLNNDCLVNFADYVIFAQYWLDGRTGQ